MAKRAGASKRYPKELLGDVAWSFTGPTFRSRTRFEEAVRDGLRELELECDWRPEEIVLRCLRVRVRPVFWDDYDPDEAERFIIELAAESPSGFTAGELLFKVHNAFLRRWQEDAGDYVFFEGFILVEAPAGDTPPLYDIGVGS